MSPAAAALFYLSWRSLLNLVLGRLRRLRQPKYLFGAVLGLGYIFLVFIYPQMKMAARRAENVEAQMPPVDLSNFIVAAISIVTLLLFLLIWLWRRESTALQFSEAEIAYLFPGPVAHDTLVHYSLIRGQATLLFTALFTTLISGGWQALSSPLWARFIGWWLVMAVFRLHVTASGFTLTRLHLRMTQWQRQLLLGALVLLAGLLIAWLSPHLHLPMPNELAPPAAFSAYLQGQIGEGALYWLLWPLRALAGPLVASDAAGFLRALPSALLVYALHYVWAFASELPDPEGSLAKAEKRAAVVQALRSGNWRAATTLQVKSRRDPFKLVAHGSPVVAFLWKNLLSTREYLNLRTVAVLAALIVGWRLWVNTQAEAPFVALIPFLVATMLGAQTLLVGAQFARQDLRSDLENADLIKTWPLAGWQIVLGELLTPTLILTGILWLCLLQIGMAPAGRFSAVLTPELRIVLCLSVALLLPFLCAAQLLVANAAAVLFPAWTKTAGGIQNQGLEAAGQRLLFFAAQLLVMLVVLVPALLFGLLVYIPVSWFLEVYAVLPAAIVAAVVLAGELAWGINWVGERFDAYDLSA
jgi:hypothetical protein